MDCFVFYGLLTMLFYRFAFYGLLRLFFEEITSTHDQEYTFIKAHINKYVYALLKFTFIDMNSETVF